MNKMGIIPLLLPAMIFLVGILTLNVDGEALAQLTFIFLLCLSNFVIFYKVALLHEPVLILTLTSN